jgi:hypothetical protein
LAHGALVRAGLRIRLSTVSRGGIWFAQPVAHREPWDVRAQYQQRARLEPESPSAGAKCFEVRTRWKPTRRSNNVSAPTPPERSPACDLPRT